MKIRNIRFVGNLILSTRCEFYFDDITVTSFINIRYCNVAVKSIPQGTAFSCGQRTSANAIHSEMRPVCGGKCFMRQEYTFGVKSLLMVEKVLLMRIDLVAALFRRPLQ